MFEILLILAWLFLCLGVMHLLLFKALRDRSTTFWKKTDYIWLTVAALGLLGVAERYRIGQVSDAIRREEALLADEYVGQQAWISTLVDTEVMATLTRMEQDPNEGPFIRREILDKTTAMHLFSRLQMTLASNRPYKDHQAEIAETFKYIEKRGAQFEKIVSQGTSMLQRAIPIEVKIETLRRRASRTQASGLLDFLSPFLLAFATALRFTKVTAESFILPAQLTRKAETQDKSSQKLLPADPP